MLKLTGSMFWIRNVAALDGGATRIVEAELGSETEIPGLLDYPQGAILCAGSTLQPDSTGLYKYMLRLQLGPAPVPESRPLGEGYLFPEGPFGELVALFSLYLQSRFYILSITDRSSHPVPLKREFNLLRGRFGPDVDSVIFSSVGRNLATGLPTFLDGIRSIPAKYHLRIAVAANHYLGALREVGVNKEMVFVRLVSAIETVAREQPISDDPLAGKDIEQLIRTDDLRQEEVNELKLLLRNRRAKARFRAFLLQFSKGFFDSEPKEPSHTQITPETLSDVASAIYDARSGYLHNGDLMYLSLRSRTNPEWHMDPSGEMTWQSRQFEAKKKLPVPEFFHRLVRHCLLGYFKSLESVEAAANQRLQRTADAARIWTPPVKPRRLGAGGGS